MHMKTRLLLLVILILTVGELGADTNVLPGYDGLFQGNFRLHPMLLERKTTEELGFLRNEIFARYGREFKTPAYREYFAKKPWYRVKASYSDNMLTPVDHENIAMILSFERPSRNEDAVRRLVLDRIEYTGDGETVVFSDETYLMWYHG
ncbi:MAG TPA: YARHG domain-containing protein, partial [Spirochaetia bacterium]|nr:YARHG domain-containing protein [Spirochaetia bacterium]